MQILLEAFGIAQQTEVGLRQLGHDARAPFLLLQALPHFQHLAGLVDHALGEVLLEAVATGIFVLVHD